MAMEVATGVLSVDTGAATTQYSVTGLSFQPKAVKFWWSGRADTADASGEADIQPGFGAAVSSTSRWATAAQADHGPTTTATDKYHTDAACVAVLDIAGAAVGLADFVSFNSDGFTLVIDDAFPALVRVSWEAYGGSDITDAAAGKFQLASGTGNANYTGLTSFTPDFALFASINDDTAPPASIVGVQWCVGAATASAQAVLAVRTANNQATSITSSYCRAGEIFAALSSVSAIGNRCSFTSFLSDGFQINKLEEASPVSPYIFFLALKGGQYKIGNFVTATNTTAFTEATGITGGAAKGAMFFSANRAESTQDACTAHLEWSVGAAVSGASQNAQYVRDKDASANADCFSAIEHDANYINGDNSAAQIIEGIGKLNSFDANGDLTEQMADADPVASFVWYVVFGNSPGQTIAVAQVTETDLAQAITRLKIKAIGQITETDLAQLITGIKIRALGQPSETNLAQAINRFKAKAITQSTETDLSQSVAWAPKRRLVGQIAESDLAQTISRVTTRAVGQVSETDLSQAIAWAPKKRFVGQVSELDLSQALSPKKLKSIAQVLETELAQAISKIKRKAIGQPSETDLAQAINGAKIKAVAQVFETDLAQAIAKRKAKLIGQVTETDLAQGISAPGSTIVAVGQAIETDIAQAISLVLRRLVAQVLETDLSQPLSRLKRKAIAQIVEIDLAQAIISLKKKLLGQALETDLSQSISRAKRKEIAQVLESDLAQTIAWVQRRLVAQVEEIDLAQVIEVVSVALTRIQILVSGELVTDISLVGVQDDNLITVNQEFIDTVSITGKVELE